MRKGKKLAYFFLYYLISYENQTNKTLEILKIVRLVHPVLWVLLLITISFIDKTYKFWNRIWYFQKINLKVHSRFIDWRPKKLKLRVWKKKKELSCWGERISSNCETQKTVTFEEVNSTSRIRPHSRDQLGFYEKLWPCM